MVRVSPVGLPLNVPLRDAAHVLSERKFVGTLIEEMVGDTMELNVVLYKVVTLLTGAGGCVCVNGGLSTKI
jgi:hypothetical protein